eukprot:516403_1
MRVFPESNASRNSSSNPSGNPGSFRSSLVSPFSVSRDRKLSSEMSSNWYSILTTLGTDVEWDVGTMSSSFLPVKMSIAVKLAFACPCFPVFDVETFTTWWIKEKEQ